MNAIYCANSDALYDTENGTHTENLVDEIYSSMESAKAACEEAIAAAMSDDARLLNPTPKLVRAWVICKILVEGETKYRRNGKVYRNPAGEWVKEY